MKNHLILPLHAVAHGRAGDKGNRSNISIIAYLPEAWPALMEQVTQQNVLDLFAPLGATRVKRYELPNLYALNFVIDDVLDGGVNASLRRDRHGKTLSFHLLGGIEMHVTSDMVPEGSPYLDGVDG
jgi:hypothetical protein